MKKKLLIVSLVVLAISAASVYLYAAASESPYPLPKGWLVAGDRPKSYDMGVDKGAALNGKNTATIKSKGKKISGFGTLMQMCKPNSYRGKRVKMSGLVKTADVSDWAGLWLRIDQAGSSEPLGFDNMHDGKTDRSLKGTHDWKRYEIVLDVPNDAIRLAYGALVSGSGQIWFDDITFEIVDESVPTTGKEDTDESTLKVPTNLDFEN